MIDDRTPHATAPFQTPGRSETWAADGMIATSHPTAALAGVEALGDGGSAVDAAVAAAFALSALEPGMTGPGGDCFALVSAPDAPPVALNGSGAAPAALDAEALRARHPGAPRLPATSVDAITVPGAVAGLLALHARYGRLDRARILRPAIAAAEAGAPVAPRVAYDFDRAHDRLSETARRHLAPSGPLGVGVRRPHPGLAATLRAVATDGVDGFYAGAVAEDMVASLQALGGSHTLDDFAVAARPTDARLWATPEAMALRGAEIFTAPPNSHGRAALAILNQVADAPGGSDPFGPDRLSRELAAARDAYAMRDREIGDPMDEAKHTVLVVAMDASGLAVSLLMSIFDTFGSGLASERFGVLFHNRGCGFALAEDHPNAIAPGKRPLHTLTPALIRADGRTVAAFGVMGGQYQAAGVARLAGLLTEADGPIGALRSGGVERFSGQTAIDAPRLFREPLIPGAPVRYEAGLSGFARERLAADGWDLAPALGPIGGAQLIIRDEVRGAFRGASDPRKDGVALGR